MTSEDINNNDNSEIITEETQVIPEIPIETPVEEVPVEEEIVPEKLKAKAKGRPTNSKDIKPRPKRKVVLKEEPVEPELPRALHGSQPIPEEANEIDKYALMLQLLHRQKQQRLQNKTDLYRSWFTR